MLFSEKDPVGTIICEINELCSGYSKSIPFVEALEKVGFTGHFCYLLPPKGKFIDMRSVVDSKIIEEMIDFGIYPYQKQP